MVPIAYIAFIASHFRIQHLLSRLRIAFAKILFSSHQHIVCVLHGFKHSCAIYAQHCDLSYSCTNIFLDTHRIFRWLSRWSLA